MAAIYEVNNNANPIEFTVLGDASTIQLDPKLLDHILTNLFGNAIKYSPQNSSIIFELNLSSDSINFRITDKGIGINISDLPHIFNSFYRASNASDFPGTGLRIAIVKQCVDLHKGKISVNSVIGEGTTFTITIPK